ncbi:energy-coupled thiamine transporter ThiT [[Clostridium] fimetarium]|uniref:Thiamine transporter n=1 Tax=[Clostridium] fimetarium TaxID=99656 RepID=A0A1I0MQQ4_9FIRM|nr:energy-coupled thiamine transporter ThiT [[Clostridium] fimetarium]SEV90919.1 thiamine transporter [[Clostridium] fimetarium]
MFNFLVSYDAEGGAYTLTKGGFICLAMILVLLLIGAAFLFNKQHSVKLGTKQLVFSAVAIALGFATSYLKIYSMPWGGSVTLCSMLFICLVGYFYGPKLGLIAALSYGILQLFQDGGSYMLDPFQVCCDYFFSFMALGLSGFFSNKKNGLLIGYIVGILGRGVFLSIGGYIYWMSYMPESFPKILSGIYPIVYNYSYILIEGIITVAIISIPAVKDALKRIKETAIA